MCRRNVRKYEKPLMNSEIIQTQNEKTCRMFKKKINVCIDYYFSAAMGANMDVTYCYSDTESVCVCKKLLNKMNPVTAMLHWFW